MHLPRFFDATAIKLGLGTALIVTCALGIGIYGISLYHRNAQVDSWQQAAQGQNKLIRQALEHQMISDDRVLIRDMVQSFAAESHVETLMILDHEGTVRFSSDPALIGQIFARDSEACVGCHVKDPQERSKFAIMRPQGRQVLRSVEPIPNRPACHECHSPQDKFNGILILDTPIQGLETELERTRAWMVGGTAVLALALLIAIGMMFRKLIFARLSALASAARLIAAGNLACRVETRGEDQIAELGMEFNRMADSVFGLLADVRAHQEQLESVMSGVDDGLLVLDGNLTIVALNESFARRCEAARETLLGCRCSEYLSGRLGCRHAVRRCPALRCFRTGRVEQEILYRSVEGIGERIEEVHASPIFGDDGSVAEVVEVWRDITERRQEEARLAEFHRLASVGMLASGFSHEVNTPLASMLTCIERIRQRMSEPSPDSDAGRGEIAELAGIINAEILRCKKVTDRFLRFSLRKELSVDLVNVCEAIEAVLPLVSSTAEAAGVTVAAERCAPSPVVLANEGAIQQVLLNLMLNAMQAGRRGGRVTVGCARSHDVRIYVRDEGPGIAAEDLKRIFEPFFSKRPGGTGLGLFLSQLMVRTWGGRIAVRSEPGVGSCFEIVFPLPQEEPR